MIPQHRDPNPLSYPLHPLILSRDLPTSILTHISKSNNDETELMGTLKVGGVEEEGMRRELTILYRFLLSTRTMISLHNTIVNFLPDFDFVTGPSLSNVLGPWYAVGAVRSSRLFISHVHCFISQSSSHDISYSIAVFDPP